MNIMERGKKMSYLSYEDCEEYKKTIKDREMALLLADLDDVVWFISGEKLVDWVRRTPDKVKFLMIKNEIYRRFWELENLK